MSVLQNLAFNFMAMPTYVNGNLGVDHFSNDRIKPPN